MINLSLGRVNSSSENFVHMLQETSAFLSNTYFTSVVQQPYGYNVTGQLQEPKDLNRPATAKVVLPYFNHPRLRYYKRSSSFNPHTRFLEYSAE
jgi:hypothetical protein